MELFFAYPSLTQPLLRWAAQPAGELVGLAEPLQGICPLKSTAEGRQWGERVAVCMSSSRPPKEAPPPLKSAKVVAALDIGLAFKAALLGMGDRSTAMHRRVWGPGKEAQMPAHAPHEHFSSHGASSSPLHLQNLEASP